MSQAIEYYQIQILSEDSNWWHFLVDLEKKEQSIKGNGIFDARIALYLKYHGVSRIFTRDADFKRYHFLKMIKPA